MHLGLKYYSHFNKLLLEAGTNISNCLLRESNKNGISSFEFYSS